MKRTVAGRGCRRAAAAPETTGMNADSGASCHPRRYREVKRMELLDGVGKLSGVGPKKEAALARLGISTLFDLLAYYPRAYIRRR